VTEHGYPAVLPALYRLKDAGTDWHHPRLVLVDAIEFFTVKGDPVHVNGVEFSGMCAAYKGFAAEPGLNAVLFVAGRQACALAQAHLIGLDNYPLEARFDLGFWHQENDRVFYGLATSIHKHFI
jgi:hypothetical protein